MGVQYLSASNRFDFRASVRKIFEVADMDGKKIGSEKAANLVDDTVEFLRKEQQDENNESRSILFDVLDDKDRSGA